MKLNLKINLIIFSILFILLICVNGKGKEEGEGESSSYRTQQQQQQRGEVVREEEELNQNRVEEEGNQRRIIINPQQENINLTETIEQQQQQHPIEGERGRGRGGRSTNLFSAVRRHLTMTRVLRRLLNAARGQHYSDEKARKIWVERAFRFFHRDDLLKVKLQPNQEKRVADAMVEFVSSLRNLSSGQSSPSSAPQSPASSHSSPTQHQSPTNPPHFRLQNFPSFSDYLQRSVDQTSPPQQQSPHHLEPSIHPQDPSPSTMNIPSPSQLTQGQNIEINMEDIDLSLSPTTHPLSPTTHPLSPTTHPLSPTTHPLSPSTHHHHPQDPSPSIPNNPSLPQSPHLHNIDVNMDEIAQIYQENEMEMPIEIKAVINEITWEEHISTPNSILNQFLIPRSFRCSICYEDYFPSPENVEQIVALEPCRHQFHLTCFAKYWSRGEKTCPLCRQPFIEDKNFKNEKKKEEDENEEKREG
ncbi:RING-type domain-containing protein [Meloidogyne graminicola]|uniref:RING-type domain-containing protein n=1 Tax=Meloidogyne graminicola TaxID=189291 RepID=A0A8S9ZQ36_9BILA|nr:RING-type domain-containing protein [Meloidogyne graminicola]